MVCTDIGKEARVDKDESVRYILGRQAQAGVPGRFSVDLLISIGYECSEELEGSGLLSCTRCGSIVIVEKSGQNTASLENAASVASLCDRTGVCGDSVGGVPSLLAAMKAPACSYEES